MADSGGPGGESQRASERQLLPLGMTANLHLASGEKVVVNLRDLSEGGVCAVRNGPLQLRVGARVEIELIDYDRGHRLEMEAAVRWVKPGKFNTMLGLQFEFAEDGQGLATFIAEHRGSGGPAA
jgi:hypothetical protein